MKKIQLIVTIIICALSVSCASKKHVRPQTQKSKALHTILNQTAKIIRDKHQVTGMGSGMAAMHRVESLYLAFRIKHKMSKDELRLMVVDAAHEMIKVVNQCEDIKPYLLPEGFNFKNVEIVFFIIGEKEEVFHPDIAVASFMRGKVKFKTNSPDNEYEYEQEDMETYAQALSILSEQGHPELLAEAEVLNSISHKLLSIKDEQ